MQPFQSSEPQVAECTYVGNGLDPMQKLHATIHLCNFATGSRDSKGSLSEFSNLPYAKGASALSRFSITCNHDDDAGLNVGDGDGDDDARISGFTWEANRTSDFYSKFKGPFRSRACVFEVRAFRGLFATDRERLFCVLFFFLVT